MNTMGEVVAAGVQAQADFDKHMNKAYRAAQRLAEITEKGVELGMVTKAIAAKTLIAEARKLSGSVASVAEQAALLHAKQTKICQENGVDTPAPSSVGGITIQGGGGR